VTSSTDQNGKTTTYTYDLDGRVRKSIRPTNTPWGGWYDGVQRRRLMTQTPPALGKIKECHAQMR